MAAGMNARRERYYRSKIIKHAAKELTKAGELNFVTERGAIKGVGFEVYSSRLNASNGAFDTSFGTAGTVNTDFGVGGNDEANARLIAAAPRLLRQRDALLALVKKYSEFGCGCALRVAAEAAIKDCEENP